MADKKIEIKIAATGGDQAAAEVKKLETAVSQVPASTGAAAQKIEDLTASVEELKKELGPVTRSAEDAGDALDDMGEKGSTASGGLNIPRVKELAGAIGAIGFAAAAAGKTLAQVKDAFDTIDTVQLRNIDAAMADQIEQARSWSSALDDPIGKLLELTTGETVASAFAGMNEQISNVARQHEEAIDRLIEKGIVQKDELKKLTDAIKAANQILDAKDDADGKARDRADEAAIRNGEAPEDVKARRAKDDADLEIRRINRDLDAKAPGVQTAFENLQQGGRNLAAVENAPNSAKPEGQEAVKKAREQLKELQDEYDRRQLEFDTAKKVADEKRRGVREEEAGKVEGLAGDKSDRLGREKQAADRKAEMERKRTEADAARARRGSLQDDLDGKESALDDTARSRGLNMRNFGLKNKNDTAASVGKALSDGTDAAEIQKLGDQVREAAGKNGEAMTSALMQVLAGLNTQAAEIEKLKGQIRKGRDMK